MKGVDSMLDERQLKAIALKFKGLEVTKIAEEVGVSRTTLYKWRGMEEFRAEVARREQEYISSTRLMAAYFAPKAMQGIMYLALKGGSEKVRLDAYSKLLDKIISNATKIELSDERDSKDNVSKDVLDDEIKEFDNE